jgi:glucose-6-phosphate 1-dehydrogenase
MATFFTIFWASWDLAKLKIYPALFTLILRDKLRDDFAIVGYARSSLSQSEFFDIFATSVRSHIPDWSQKEEATLMSLENRVHYISAPYDSQEGFERYRDLIEHHRLRSPRIPTQVLYLAVPPSIVSPILTHFAWVFPDRGSRDIRVILEKPFGHDEISARTLLSELREYYDEDELYFLDHYMGKKSMRSLLALRAKNRIIDTMIDPREIARIEISALEDFDVRDRVGYFDSVGIIRDMVQSHLFEMLALVTLELPSIMDPETISWARKHLLETLEFDPERHQIVIGQYESYQSDHIVTHDSQTETYVALSLGIDSPRWRGVPIYLRSGKSLQYKETYIVITFRPSAHALPWEEPNRIIISLYPEETLSLRFLDESWDRRETHEVVTRDSIRGHEESYLGSHELLFLDAIDGEKRFFLTPEEILASWKCIDRILEHIRVGAIPLQRYPNQSVWPIGQFEVLREWYRPQN